MRLTSKFGSNQAVNTALPRPIPAKSAQGRHAATGKAAEKDTTMKYNKPKLSYPMTALSAIQGAFIKRGFLIDAETYIFLPNDFRPTSPAYEADE
jgi:hypothetical protein